MGNGSRGRWAPLLWDHGWVCDIVIREAATEVTSEIAVGIAVGISVEIAVEIAVGIAVGIAGIAGIAVGMSATRVCFSFFVCN